MDIPVSSSTIKFGLSLGWVWVGSGFVAIDWVDQPVGFWFKLGWGRIELMLNWVWVG